VYFKENEKKCLIQVAWK